MVGILSLLGAKELADQFGGEASEAAPEVKGPGLLKQAGSFGWAALKTAYSPSGQNHMSQWNQNRVADNQYRNDINEQRKYQDHMMKKLDMVLNGGSSRASAGRNLTKMNYVVDRTAEDMFTRAPTSFSKLAGNFEKFSVSDVKGNDAAQVTLQINNNFRKISAQITSINTALKVKNDELIKYEGSMNERLAKVANVQQAQIQRFNAQIDSNLNTIESTLSQLSMKIDVQDRQLDMLAQKISMGGGNSRGGFSQAGPISTGLARTANNILPHQSFGQNPLWFLGAAALTNPTVLSILGKALGPMISWYAGMKIAEYFGATEKQKKERDKSVDRSIDKGRVGPGLRKENSDLGNKAIDYSSQLGEFMRKYPGADPFGIFQRDKDKEEAQKARTAQIKRRIDQTGMTDKEARLDLEYAKKRDQIRQRPEEGEAWGWFADDNLKGTGTQSLMGEDTSKVPGQARGGAYLGGGISGDRGRHKSFLQSRAHRMPAPVYAIPTAATTLEQSLFGEKRPTSTPEQAIKVETKDYEIKSQDLIHIESQREIKLISRSKIVLDAPEIEFKTDKLTLPGMATAPGATAGSGSGSASRAGPKPGSADFWGQNRVGPDPMQRLQSFMNGTSPAGRAAMGGVGGGSPAVGGGGGGTGGFEDPNSIILKQGANPNDPSITSSMIDDALKMKGLHEVKDRDTLKQYLKTGGVNMDPSTTAWCAAFVNSTLQQHGVQGSNSQLAASFNRWGTGVKWEDAKKGDVLSRAGHVGFFTGNVNEKGQYEMLGGNQSNKVTTKWVNPGSYNVRRAILDEKHQVKLPGGQQTVQPGQATAGNAVKAVQGTGNIPVDARGNVNKQSFYNEMVAKVSQSKLNGFIPADGQKYGIDGTPQSWANFLSRVANQESGFNTRTTNPGDPGGSFGIFQFGNHYGINQQNWQDPNAQIDAAINYSEKWVVDGGGYVLPPAGVEAKRYHGRGGFGAAFASVNKGHIDQDRHYALANELAAGYTGQPQVPGQVPGQPQVKPNGLTPASFWQDGSTPSHSQRQQVFAQGGVVVNLDTNWSAGGKQTGPLVVIPDGATDEQRKQAEAYVKKVEDAYKDKFGTSLKGKVVTRSQNGRGRPGTIHTEPFAVNDAQAVEYFTKDPEGKAKLADITSSTLGQVPGVKFSLPHDPYNASKRDMGAHGSGTNEVDIARGLMGDLKSRIDPNVDAIHQSNAGRQPPGVPTAQALMAKHTVTTENTVTQGYKDDVPYKGRGGGPSPRSQLMAPPPPAPAFGMGKKFGDAVLPKPHGRGTPGMPMVKKEDLPKPKGPPKPGDLSGRASRDKNPRQEQTKSQTGEEKARGARGGAYAGSMPNQERVKDAGVRGDQGTEGDIRTPRSDSGDSNPPAPGDDGTGSYDSICYV